MNILANIPTIGGLSRSAAALSLPEILESIAPWKTVIVCSSDDEAEKWLQDLEFFMALQPSRWRNTQLLFLPGWEQSPYRNLQQGSVSRHERLSTLYKAHTSTNWIMVCTFRSFLQRAPEAALLRRAIPLSPGATISPEDLCKTLHDIGYSQAESVEDPGTFSQRGGIVDVFPITQPNPIRIEFFDELVESVRTFNPETQRSMHSLGSTDKIDIIPARDFPCDLGSMHEARLRMKAWCDQKDLPKIARERIGNILNQGIVSPELDYLLPFFQKHPCWLTDIIPDDSFLLLPEFPETNDSRETWQEKETALFEDSLLKQNVIPGHKDLYASLESALSSERWGQKNQISTLSFEASEQKSIPIRLSKKGATNNVDQLTNIISGHQEQGISTVLVANSIAQLDRISFLLSHKNIRVIPIESFAPTGQGGGHVYSFMGAISESLLVPEKKIAFISEDEIFGSRQHRKKIKGRQLPPISMDELSIGELVVHSEHGIGRFLGLTKMRALNGEADYVALEYADGDKLYVPVYRLEALGRYIGAPGVGSRIDKLGSGSFAKAKESVKSAVKEIAQDLIRVHAERELKQGYAFSPPDDTFRAFEAEFPFDETPDQATAIEDTIHDMCQNKPMDRLVCGDVGFGKTEVAIRAAFKAVQDGKQVAVLVPTTILAEQHHQTFSQRMKNQAVRIASISRFRSSKEQREIVDATKNGTVDVLIGTHRILSKDIHFKDLGLLIIDEEQRFGVEHKEKLKQVRATTDVLTLTATPIPRTLQMSLMGIKDVSIIRTPPGDRLTIKTYLSTFDGNIIQNAIRNELGRGGQVFFIHNRVQTIAKMMDLVKKLVPESSPVVAHGQMTEGSLEKAMLGFYQKKYDVLIATAIIENGLDVPNANTLIVDRADTFGLAQLYQIRGRVGRSQTRAFAYLLVPETGTITQEAKERLSVLQRFVELGSGYSIATHDLEIRGGGDVLGQAQSGHIASVGYDLYIELLQEEVHRLRGEVVAHKKVEDVEINLPIPAYLPQEYVADAKARITLYRRLSSLMQEEDIKDAELELEDRYGPLPNVTQELMWVLRLKILMRRLGLKALTLGPKGISLSPGENPLLEPGMILQMVHSRPDTYTIRPDGKFVLHGKFLSTKEVYTAIHGMLQNTTQ